MRRLITFLIAAASLPAAAQTRVDLRTQSKSVDFTAASSTKPLKTGTTLPAACTLGEMFFKTDAPAGRNVYGCAGADTWQPQAGKVTVENGGTVVGVQAAQNFVVGPGLVNALSDTGTRINIQQNLDTAVVQTRTATQSGSALLCASASGSGSAYTCSMNPSLASYTPGMVLFWKPDVGSAGAAVTIDVDMLGAKPVKLADGSTDPTGTDILAGRLYPIWYDGAGFRLMTPLPNPVTVAQSGSALLCASASGSGSVYTCSMNPSLGSYTPGMVLFWKPDVGSAGVEVTINVDMLGAKAVKLADGSTDPTGTDILAGRLYPIWYDGTGFRLMTPLPDPVTVAQSGSALLCASASGSGSAYTCSMNPSLGSYTPGMVLFWKPDVGSAGVAVTINVDTLGAKPVKLADGSTDPTGTDILAGRLYPIWYDGTGFRLMIPLPNAVTVGTDRPLCDATLRGRIWQTPGAEGVKDEVAVCAKDELDGFEWRTLY